jgi:hypothetical protein
VTGSGSNIFSVLFCGVFELLWPRNAKNTRKKNDRGNSALLVLPIRAVYLHARFELKRPGDPRTGRHRRFGLARASWLFTEIRESPPLRRSGSTHTSSRMSLYHNTAPRSSGCGHGAATHPPCVLVPPACPVYHTQKRRIL